MSLIKKVFRRGNVLVLVLVMAALLGAMNVPQSMGISSDKIILALLAVLALDALIERLGYLDRIEHKISELSTKIEPTINSDILFHSSDQLPPFSRWLQQHDDFLISGVATFALINKYGSQIEKAAMEGKRFRVLLANPRNKLLMEILANSSFTYHTPSAMEQVIRAAKIRYEEISQKTGGALEIGLLDCVFHSSNVIADGKKNQGQMTVDYYSYKISLADRYHLLLTKINDRLMFNFHLNQFEMMWKDATKLATRKA